MWFPISANPPLKQSLNSRKEYIQTFNYPQGLISFKMHLMLPKNRWPTPTLGLGVGWGGMYGWELELNLLL